MYITIPGQVRREGPSGGLIVAIKSSFSSTRLPIAICNAHAEIMGVKVTLNSTTLHILNEYSRTGVITENLDLASKDLSGPSVVLGD